MSNCLNLTHIGPYMSLNMNIKLYSKKILSLHFRNKVVKLACLVKLAFTHHEERVVGGPTDNRLSIRRTGYILLSHAKKHIPGPLSTLCCFFVPHQLFFHHCIFLHNEFDEEFACSALVMANVEMDAIRDNKEEPSSVEAAVGDVGDFKMQSIAERDDAGLRRVGKQPVLKV
jgi:hypothetical protein